MGLFVLFFCFCASSLQQLLYWKIDLHKGITFIPFISVIAIRVYHLFVEMNFVLFFD